MLPMRQAFRNFHSSKLQQNVILVKNYITAFLCPLFKGQIFFSWLADIGILVSVCFHGVFKNFKQYLLLQAYEWWEGI